MSVLARLAAFVVALGAVFAAGWAIGSAVGPFDEPAPPPAHTEHAP